MSYIEAVLTLFAIVDPVGNIPIMLDVAEHVPNGQSQKAFNTAVVVGALILLAFSFAGKTILNNVFHIELADLQLAGGILLLIIAIDHLIFGSLRRSIAVKGTLTPHEIGCVPLACPLLAAPPRTSKTENCSSAASRSAGLHGIFKSDVPVYRRDWGSSDNGRTAALFCCRQMTAPKEAR